jgi:hypothetical protein
MAPIYTTYICKVSTLPYCAHMRDKMLKGIEPHNYIRQSHLLLHTIRPLPHTSQSILLWVFWRSDLQWGAHWFLVN